MPTRDPEGLQALRRLGHAVAKRRIIAGQSQDDVAEASGVSDRFVRALERGSGNPSYLTLRAIARALGTDTATLMREAETASA
jgi:putative transcriptional regulator